MVSSIFTLIAEYVLASLCVVALFAWTTLSFRQAGGLSNSPILSDFSPASGQVDVVVALRNESENVDSLLSNLTKVSCVSKIVLVDDSSEDDTLEKCVSWTHNPGVIAVSAGTPPSNWGGKSYACYIGASMCEHDWILFLDADTRMDVDAVGAALGYCSKTGAEAVSVSPQLVCPGLWDKVATPFYSFLLNSFIKMSDVNSQSKRTSYFYGSFMMFKAESYWRIGGHAAVATDL
ncbi:MAG: glycosyltransferase family 2 protein, partial [Thermoprotei archaeon]